MMWIGPRVTVGDGEDLHALSWLARRNARGIPVRATLVQCTIVNLLILVTTFQKVVNYVQFSLTLFSALTVLGVLFCAGGGPICLVPTALGDTRLRRRFFSPSAVGCSGICWGTLPRAKHRSGVWPRPLLGSLFTGCRQRARLTTPPSFGKIPGAVSAIPGLQLALYYFRKSHCREHASRVRNGSCFQARRGWINRPQI